MSIFDNLLNIIKTKYPEADDGSFSYDNVSSALVIQIKGGDVHSSLRPGSSAHKDQIDLTYGPTLPEDFSPVDDFFPTIHIPKILVQAPHLVINCRIWGECLLPSTLGWIDSKVDVTRRELNSGVNPALQLRGVDSLRKNILENDWLIFLHQQKESVYEAFSLKQGDWSGKVKEVLHKSSTTLRPVYFNYTSLIATTPKNNIPKPFILLAGISGTGKTRFVREQAEFHTSDQSNFCLIPVRPDWHEPSDLLGYISRISPDGPQYVVTRLLQFVVAALKVTVETASSAELIYKSAELSPPYWLCLDEMNLAPVEQYFADYLSVVESRKWDNGKYTCLPLLPAISHLNLNDYGNNKLRQDLKLQEASDDDLWDYLYNNGIPLPHNLIVAGTVNMDETTHGFSRKVIDRAFTIDFGEFYPTQFSEYFAPKIQNLPLSFPTLSYVTLKDLSKVIVDSDGNKSIQFLEGVNKVLEATQFELAYRALNELLLAVVCFNPIDDISLSAVWDDFIMTKVLPRIDGDIDKLRKNDGTELLLGLEQTLSNLFTNIWNGEIRPDLLRKNADSSELKIECRSKRKLLWMQNRLRESGFTTFWP